ncbi:unnamed protein product [Parnassius apollo]|uniref:(apollo) hypothetical protein n=1 Tax=Parnassius apollo TaxID=110799 RepID=A0A8S3YC73_PARAO|nr:unnamed protein product [Parnassius apollo]
MIELIAIKIVKIEVPEIIQYGLQDAVILDCDYTYGNNTSGLVVKWFFRNKARPVYQWIVSQKPQDMGILRGRVDLAYRASSDPLKMHRALRIVKPDTDISGDYTCVVSTFMEEDSRTKQMIVFGKTIKTRIIEHLEYLVTLIRKHKSPTKLLEEIDIPPLQKNIQLGGPLHLMSKIEGLKYLMKNPQLVSAVLEIW